MASLQNNNYNQSKLIYDIGMYDACDTQYYLDEGYKVVAVEANPTLIQRAVESFKREIKSGQLTLVNAAVADKKNTTVTLEICGDDLGSSSIYINNIASKNPIAKFTVKGVSLRELIDQYGRPYHLKVDIEGADRFCILPLTEQDKPEYISYEVGDDFEELTQHLSSIGFTKFKLINQCSFRELDNQNNLYDRINRKIMYLLGYKDPAFSRHHGRFFKIGHSSGPAPWASDGHWCTATELLDKYHTALNTNQLCDWYDAHAM